ncbi:MAG: primosomal protein N' family DNA-binding protein [Actinomycetota bacterium]
MTSAARSPSPAILSGTVDVCVDRPVLSLDRPFTYELPAELGAGVGSLIQVPFHGRAVRGWVLGAAASHDVPARLLPVKKLVSTVRFFDESQLELLRWVSERYVEPLASVIERSVPPRVVSEEVADLAGVAGVGAASLRGGRFAHSARFARSIAPAPSTRPLLAEYRHGPELLDAIRGGSGLFVVRPTAADEQVVAVEAVSEAVAGGRGAIVLVPELEPLPATARAVLEAFGEDAVLFAGGSKRARYRTWLEIADGMYRVVVGTRPAVFAPVPELGLVYVSRESHAGHREERSPYFHVRDVAIARARLRDAVCVMSAMCPSAEAAATDAVDVAPARRWWPPVEVVKPGPEGRAPRLVSLLRSASRAFVYSPLPGAGIARVCRNCGEPASCSACGGTLRAEGGVVRCVVCGAEGRCAFCGSTRFGIAPGGAERVEAWASRLTRGAVRRVGDGTPPHPVGEAEIVVGGVEAVKEFGPEALGLDVVAVLDADLAARRPGLSARERALATWMEVASWASPSGRVIVQTRSSNDAAVQALVTGNPARFHRAELTRRADAGFPPAAAVFRVAGSAALATAIETFPHRTLLVTGLGDETLCLLALDAGDVPAFGRAMRDLAGRGVVTRVEAEPHL